MITVFNVIFEFLLLLVAKVAAYRKKTCFASAYQ